MSAADAPKKTSLAGKIIAAPVVALLVLMVVAAAIAFPAFGLYMTWQTGALLVNWQRAKGWVETPATITHLDLRVQSGDQSNTYQVVCRYTYAFNGVRYEGSRVGFSGGSDNVGQWQNDTYARLRQHVDQFESEPVSCWVNPKDPTEAVLDRGLRWEMIVFSIPFVICFGGGSIGFYTYAFLSHRRKRVEERFRADHPDQPWMWKARWAEGRIPSQTGRKSLAIWAFAILWNALAIPASILFVPPAIESRQYGPLFVLLFPAVGLAMLAAAIVSTLRYWRFRRSVFELESVPGVIGGHLKGRLTVVGDVTSTSEVAVALRCVNRVTVNSGEDSRTTERTLWEDGRTVPAMDSTFGQAELSVPVDFQIPYDCLPCDDSNAKDQTLWRLTAKAEIPGANLDMCFDVPVFRTKASQPEVGEAPEKVARIETVLNDLESPLPMKMHRERDLDGNPVLVVSASPGWFTLSVFTFLAVGSLIGGGIWFQTITQPAGWPILPPIVLCLGGLAALCAEVLGFSGSVRTIVKREAVVVERTRPFLGRSIEIPRQAVLEVKASESASTNSGTEMTQHYAVHLITSNGRKVKLGGMIPGEQATQWLVRQIENELSK